MKYQQAIRGKAATEECDFPNEVELDENGAPKIDPLTGEPKPLRFLFRPILGPEDAEAHKFARGYAKRFDAEPKLGDPTYDMGYKAAVVAISAEDKDSPENARTPFFEGTTLDERMNVAAGLHREIIGFLYARQDAWQCETSPLQHHMDAETLLKAIEVEATSDDDAFFAGMSPATQKDFAHSLACLVWSSPEARSLVLQLIASAGTGPKRWRTFALPKPSPEPEPAH